MFTKSVSSILTLGTLCFPSTTKGDLPRGQGDAHASAQQWFAVPVRLDAGDARMLLRARPADDRRRNDASDAVSAFYVQAVAPIGASNRSPLRTSNGLKMSIGSTF